MKVNKIFITMIVFLFLISGLFNLIPNINAKISVNTFFIADNFQGGSCTRSTNGTLFCLSSGLTGTRRELDLNISFDNGTTWVNNIVVDNDANYYLKFPTIACNSYDNIYVLYDTSNSVGGIASTILKQYNVIGTLISTTTIHSWTTYTVTGAKMVIDYNNNIHMVYSGYSSSDTGYIYYKQFNYQLQTFGSEQIVTSGTNVKGNICLDMDVIYNIYGCTPYVFYNNLTSGKTVFKNGMSWSTTQEFVIASASNRIDDFKVSYDSHLNEIIFFYDNPDNNEMDWIIFYTPTYVISAVKTVCDNSIYVQNNPAISITNSDIVNFFWSGTSELTGSSKIRILSYNLITGENLTNGYVTGGNDNHIKPFVMNTMYPSQCKLIVNYVLFYFNSSTNTVVFDNDINPIYLYSNQEQQYNYNGYLYFRFYDINTNERLAFHTQNYVTNYSSFIDARIFVNGNEVTYLSNEYNSETPIAVVTNFTDNTSSLIKIFGWLSPTINGGFNGLYSSWYSYTNNFSISYGSIIDIFLQRQGIPTLNDYINRYGNFFIEFENGFIPENYKINDYARLIYNLSNISFDGGNGYIWDMVKTGVTNQIVASGIISFMYSDSGIIKVITYPLTEGYYNIELYSMTSNNQKNSIVYTSHSIYVVGIVTPLPSQNSSIMNWISNLDYATKSIIGLVITVLFLFLPLIIILIFKSDIELPYFIYLISGILGIIISTALGFFDYWVLAFIILIATLITGILWLSRKNE